MSVVCQTYYLIYQVIPEGEEKKKKITVIRLQQQDEKLDSDFKEKIGQ